MFSMRDDIGFEDRVCVRYGGRYMQRYVCGKVREPNDGDLYVHFALLGGWQ